MCVANAAAVVQVELRRRILLCKFMTYARVNSHNNLGDPKVLRAGIAIAPALLVIDALPKVTTTRTPHAPHRRSCESSL
jgi:hypothetical protein